MRRLGLCVAAGLLLGSASLPASRGTPSAPPPPAPRLAYASVLDEDSVTAPPAPVVVEPPPSRVQVVVSIPQQKLYLFRDGELIDTSRVSTGKRGHSTPAGTFPILQKKVRHHSNLYDNAPMPYMQRLTYDGVALHAGHVPGYPASHGCIRMPWSFAKKLYGITDFGTKVTVTRQRPKSAEHALALA